MTMPFQVLGGPTRESEFEKYIEALGECKLSTERQDGRVGVVETHEQAKEVLAKVQLKIPYLRWQVVELIDVPNG
jgi:hypothetical protein